MDPQADINTKTGNSKMVKGCFTMGVNVEVGGKVCNKNVAGDLKELLAYFTVKPVQT